MTDQVVVTQRAKDDLRRYYSVAAEYAPETAARWLDRCEASLQTLRPIPNGAIWLLKTTWWIKQFGSSTLASEQDAIGSFLRLKTIKCWYSTYATAQWTKLPKRI